jgi:hypothetical protein
VAQDGVCGNSVLFKVVGKGNDERGVGNNDILVVCEGDNTLPMNDNSGVMRSDGGSDTQFCFFFETI